jgi:hypothetical protein
MSEAKIQDEIRTDAPAGGVCLPTLTARNLPGGSPQRLPALHFKIGTCV